MGKLPAFQFYPNDWLSNVKLRRCSLAARGAWMDVLCILHDSDEYGLIRWPLKELSQATGVPIKVLNELVQKEVLKGSDKGCSAYTFKPRSGRKEGNEVVLIENTSGPIWYSSRLVKDNYLRMVRGNATRFTSENTHLDETLNPSPKVTPNPTPNPPFGEVKSDGSSSSSSSSYNILCIKARDLTCNFFGINEIKNFKAFKEISEAIALIDQREKTKYYIQQIESYNRLKNLNGQQKCNYLTWLFGEGRQQVNPNIDNGHWCRMDYESLIKEFEKDTKSDKNHGKSTKSTAAIESGEVKNFGPLKL
jgi:hypothetical protein